MLIAAEEGAAWNVLHPEFAVVVPKPVTTRSVAMVARATDPEWLRFLDGWVEFKRASQARFFARKVQRGVSN
jgi:hypothetical protein